MKTIIEIEICNIEVTEDGYFSFEYIVTRDGGRNGKIYSSDFSGQTAKQFREILEKGEAINIVLGQIS